MGNESRIHWSQFQIEGGFDPTIADTSVLVQDTPDQTQSDSLLRCYISRSHAEITRDTCDNVSPCQSQTHTSRSWEPKLPYLPVKFVILASESDDDAPSSHVASVIIIPDCDGLGANSPGESSAHPESRQLMISPVTRHGVTITHSHVVLDLKMLSLFFTV